KLLDAGANPTAVDHWGYTPLHRAAGRGHAGVVRELLRRSVDPNLADRKYRKTALHKAAEGVDHAGGARCIDALINGGAKLELTDSADLTPLHGAIMSDNARNVKRLLERGADPNRRGWGRYTPLQLAAKFGHDRMLLVLLHHGARIQDA